MAKFKLIADSIPDLQLSWDEEQRIINETDELIAETLHASEDFISQGRKLDSHRWRQIKTRENHRVSRTRKMHSSGVGRGGGNSFIDSGMPELLSMSLSDSNESILLADSSEISSTGRNYFRTDAVIDRYRPPHIPLLIVTGTMEGTIEDAAFGNLSDNLHRWRVLNAYLGDDYAAIKQLATIHRPTKEDPFRFLGVKWLLKELGMLTRPRDFLFAESSGMAIDSNGERVSYLLMHSLVIERLPELRQHEIIRLQTSICSIYRRHSDSTVEVFCRAFTDTKGNLLESVSIAVFADVLLTSVLITELSNVKKLLWLLNKKGSARTQGGRKQHLDDDQCFACTKNLTKLGLIQTGSLCALCRQQFCTKCSVSKKLPVDLGDAVTQKPFSFCVRCVLEAKHLSAWDIAIDTLPQEHKRSN